jgi:uncharacterized membrane protein YhiD involved in acid resistance
VSNELSPFESFQKFHKAYEVNVSAGIFAGMLDITALSTTTANPTAISIFYALMLAFVLGTVIAFLYVKTFNGLSYSRNFIHCLVLCPLVTAVAMQAIGDNLARGIGMIGAISLLRFRTNLKDPRDMFFLFASLALGVSCGVHSYVIGVIGCIGFVLAISVLAYTPFGNSNQYDGLLRFNLSKNLRDSKAFENMIEDNCKSFALITIRESAQGERLDYVYQFKLKNGRNYNEFVRQLQEIESIKGVNLMLQETTIEV